MISKENLQLGGKYWDLFDKRSVETVDAINRNISPPLRRLSLHITNRCNMNCSYCNEHHTSAEMSFDVFEKLVREYSEMGGGVLHITGGEPTVVKFFDRIFDCVSEYPNVDFHLNTNSLKRLTIDQYKNINRLKILLDTTDGEYFNDITRVRNAFEIVTDNLDFIHDKIVIPFGNPTVSLTYTVTRQNFRQIPDFLRMYYERWPHFYAVFFSSYKGIGDQFLLNKFEVKEMFSDVVSQINELTASHNDLETRVLFETSHNEQTFDPNIRFPINKFIPCYIQMSEIAINEKGEVWNCSHLLRDQIPPTGVNIADGHLSEVIGKAKKQFAVPLADECLFGCNKKLQTFNQYVFNKLGAEYKNV